MAKSREDKIEKFNTIKYGVHDTVPRTDQYRYELILKNIKKGQKVLDLGCWSGNLMRMIAEKGATVEGIEVSKTAHFAAQKTGFKVYNLNLEGEWSKKLESKYDHVIAGEIIEHIYDTDAFLQEISKVLKKGGHLTVTTPNIASLGRRLMLLSGINPHTEFTLREKDAGHIRYFTFQTLKKLLEENGFVVVSCASTYVNFDMRGILRSKLLARLFPTLGTTIILYTRKR